MANAGRANAGKANAGPAAAGTAPAPGKALVIVESPTKARTLTKFLPSGYVVESSIGHIRDLPESAAEIPPAVKGEPWARLGVDIEHGFKPLYVVPNDKKAQVAKLKALLKDADSLYLATDEDREGESISWHLREVLKPKVPTRRMVFHEITKDAILGALSATREIDERLVSAQETRRLLDRLYGYEVSPLLWRKIAPRLSAGRVQSVAVRIVVERERERMAFRSGSYWDLKAVFTAPNGAAVESALISVDGKRLVSGKDFDPATGEPAADKGHLVHLDQAAAAALRERLAAASFAVSKVEQRPYTSQPPPPFTTSTLQQEANRKLGLSSRDTMRVAQGLYERGFITYMRTDSTTLSEQALNAARKDIASRYGDAFLPPEPRVYRSTVRNAQEAHEAIRPAGDAFRSPDSLRGEVEERELKLYDLIWKRTMASQMPNARGQHTLVQASGGGAVFQAGGKTIEFPGYLRAYVEGSDDPDAELGDQERILPPLAVGDPLAVREIQAAQHFTQPPPRYSEASLIQQLERQGIGRPSTYASIIATILGRDYVLRRGNQLVPTFTAFAVVQLLEQYFTRLVDLGFTARMEDALDAISRGEGQSEPYLREFYFGAPASAGLKELLKADIDPRRACTLALGTDSAGRPISVRIGRYGPYLERDTERVPIPAGTAPDELTLEAAERLLARGNAPVTLGSDPASGKPVYLKAGRFGPYVQLGDAPPQPEKPARRKKGAQPDRPKMKSLLPGQTPETVTLEDALKLLSLPRPVGTDPATGESIAADLGRFGPYIKRGEEYRSLPTPDSVFTVTQAEALELLAQPKRFRRGQPQPIREVGKHPESGVPIRLMNGRYGPYVTDGETNASLPRGDDPAQLTLERALDLLAARKAAGPAARRPARRAARAPQAAGAARKPRASSSGRSRPAGAAHPRAGAAPQSAEKQKPALRKKGQRAAF